MKVRFGFVQKGNRRFFDDFHEFSHRENDNPVV